MEHQPINLQLRVTDESLDNIKDCLGFNFISNHLVFRHQPTNNPENIHYHIYLFGIHRTAETLRNILRRKYEKTRFAVSVTAGRSKVKITPEMAFQYAMNPKSNPQLVSHQGFTDEEIQKMKTDAENYYKPIEAVLITHEEHYVVRRDRIWERLRIRQQDGHYDGLSVQRIKSKLAAEWLNEGKAMMRNADCHRYAVSIYMLCKYKNKAEIPEDAFLSEYNVSQSFL